jgi:regulatory protein
VNDELRQLAMRLLARREHSSAELARKLARAGGGSDEVAEVILRLQQSGLLSDARFAESYVRSHAARHGSARLRQVLKTKGIAQELVETCLAGADVPDELARARAIWQRKFGELPHDAKSWAQQARFLQGRGFAVDTIRRLLKDPEGHE